MELQSSDVWAIASKRIARIAVGIAASLAVLEGCASTTSTGRRAVAADSAALAQFERERAARGAESALPTIGVTPFRVEFRKSNLDALGYALADLITTDLARSSQLQLVERTRLGDVLREQEFGRSGRVDSSTAPRIGRLLRADRLVLGSLDTLANGELRVGVRIADVQTGLLQQAIDARAPIADILDAEKTLVLRLFESLNITLTPAERTMIAERRTTSAAALTAYGKGVQAELAGDRRRAQDEYERALQLDPAFTPPAERIADMRAQAQSEQESATLVPAAKKLGAPVSGAVDRLNRPLDLITSITRPAGGPGDPAFPSTLVTILLRIQRP